MSKEVTTKASKPTPLLLKIEDVSRLLSVSVRTVWTLVSKGEMRAVKMGARATRSPTSEVMAYLQKLTGGVPTAPVVE